MQDLRINERTAGGRMDKAVMKYLDKAPAGFVYKMLRKKNILLNGHRAKGDEKLENGDVIRLYLSDETIETFHSQVSESSTDSLPPGMIAFEDEQLIALNKPSGMLSQKSSDSDESSLNDLLLRYLGSDDLFTPGISNRLDRNTSGLVLAGKNPNAVRILNDAIKNRSLEKLYLCPVKGTFARDRILEGYLQKDEKSNTVRVYDTIPASVDHRKYSYIRTSCKVLSSTDRCSLLLIDLITGKSHQIRAHLASIGHPVIGDPKYGDSDLNRYYRNRYKIRSQLLHAYQVHFIQMQGILEYLNGSVITASLPEYFDRFLKGEGLCLHGRPED